MTITFVRSGGSEAQSLLTEPLAGDASAEAATAEGVRRYMALLAGPDPMPVALQFALWRATYALYLSNCRAIEALGLPVRVTGKRLAILRTLFFAPERRMTLGALCKIVHLGPAAATNFVDSLCRGSLVRRSSDGADRPGKTIELTARGEEVFLKIVPALSRRWMEACASLTAEEKDTLVRLLQRLS